MTTAIAPLPNAPGPGWVGQGTAIEQSRAIEEVRAAMVVAQQCPRNEDAALAGMRRSCGRMELASRAFFAFPRGGETVSGETIHLARELARNWGNISHGVTELRRDDPGGTSEMQAFAWDLQTNVRSAHVFIVPHRRDTKKGVRTLTDLRDIYENNANNGARRLREAIFSVMPIWYTAEAVELCRATLSGISGAELETRIERAVRAYDRLGVTIDQLEAKVGRRRPQWTGQEFATLDVLFSSLRRNELTVEEAFPREDRRLTVADVAEPEPAPPAEQAAVARIRKAQSDKMHALAGELDLDRDARIIYTNEVLRTWGGPEYRQVESSKELTETEAGWLLDQLQSWADNIEPPQDGEPS
jgi:hypothetical protein